MVGNEGQIFTIEGVAAAVLLLATAYIILNSTSILTPGDAHISDMQLQQLGDDVLRIMDTSLVYNASANTEYEKKMSNLERDVLYWDNDSFKNEFFNFTYPENDTSTLPLHMDANISYWNSTTSNVTTVQFLTCSTKTNREHSVTVSRWVNLADHIDLIEVQLWRD